MCMLTLFLLQQPPSRGAGLFADVTLIDQAPIRRTRNRHLHWRRRVVPATAVPHCVDRRIFAKSLASTPPCWLCSLDFLESLEPAGRISGEWAAWILHSICSRQNCRNRREKKKRKERKKILINNTTTVRTVHSTPYLYSVLITPSVCATFSRPTARCD